ncbi:MAG: lysylphosphatidylglycerol synthase transmembrane domain-containing protein [Patescibacteria group bacterium]|jgi:uncharacterized protein (TIRG00374 family)
MTKILTKYSFIIGFIILALIAWKMDFSTIFESLKNANYVLALMATLLVIPLLFIKSWRWNYLKNVQGIKYKLVDSFIIYNIGFLIGIITPGKIGEITKIFYLKKENFSTGKLMVSIFMDRFFDIIYLLIFGYIGIIISLRELQEKINYIYLIAIILIIILAIATRSGLYKLLLKKTFYLIIPEKYQLKWRTNFSDFWSDLKLIKFKSYLIGSLFTISTWLLYYFQVNLFAQSINLNIPFFPLAIAATVSILIALLPLSILGIGTREAVLIIMLGSFTNDFSKLVILSQLILLANVVSAFIGVICWRIKPLPINVLKNEG